MSLLFVLIRTLHITCGMMALFLAPAAMLAVKGGAAHRRWGRLYIWMMGIVAVTAMYMAVYRPVVFLGLVAIFSSYFAFSGYRKAVRKNRPPEALDWTATGLTMAGSVILIALGLHPPAGQFLPAPAVSITFGIVGVVVTGIDVLRFLQLSDDEHKWMYLHMAGMLASYIATVSAFSAVNFMFLPVILRWLWPTIVGVPGIFLWIAQRKRLMNNREHIGNATL